MQLNASLRRMVLAGFVAALPAFAQLTQIPQPNAAYTGGTTLIPITAADGTSLSSITSGPQTVTFSSAVIAGTVPGTWATWNTPPAVESATPRVLTDVGATSLTLFLSKPSTTFGFEVEPTNFGPFTISATYLNGTTVLGTLTQTINGKAGALLAAEVTNCASCANLAITSVVITAPAGAGGFAIAQVRFAAAGASVNPVTEDSPFQVRYAANLNFGESYINITNTGANGAPLLGPGFGGASGNICVNVYAFDAGEELISCCSCLITPDETVNLGVNRDLTVKTLTGVVPTSVTVKLLATLAGAGGTGSSCTNTAATVSTATIVAGMTATGTTLHATPVAGTYATTETAFTPGTLSAGELASIGGRCASILGNGSTYGVCQSCRAGALGASKSQ